MSIYMTRVIILVVIRISSMCYALYEMFARSIIKEHRHIQAKKIDCLKLFWGVAFSELVCNLGIIIVFGLQKYINGYSHAQIMRMSWNLTVMVTGIGIILMLIVLNVLFRELYRKYGTVKLPYRIFLWSLLFLYVIFRITLKHNIMDAVGNTIRIFTIIQVVAIIIIAGVVQLERDKQLARANYNLSLRILLMREHLYGLQQQMELFRKFRHDTANHMQVITSVSGELYEKEMERYAKQLQNQYPNIQNQKYCDDIFLNALFNHKVKLAEKEKITLTIDIKNIKKVYIESADCVIVIANLLDNAIEACIRARDKSDCEIHFKMEYREHQIKMECFNTMDSASVLADGEKTVKREQKKYHGIGSSIIRDIVKEYHGEEYITYAEEWYRVQIVLNEKYERGKNECN